MKLITISGPPSSGKTSVILRLVESLKESGMEKIGVVKFDCLTSVSYTHLDVYKRQTLLFSDF